MRIVKRITDQDTRDPKTLAYIDMEGIGKGNPLLEDSLLTFQIKAYSKFSYAAGDQFWISLFKPLNQFLRTLTPAEHLILGEMFGRTKTILDDDFTHIGQIEVISKRLSEIVFTAFDSIQLSRKLIAFIINTKMPIPDLSNVGTKSYHKPENTFGYDEYVGLTAIALICKLVCPIFSEIIFRTKNVLDNSLKEIHCITILRLVLGQDFSELTEKLQLYLLTQTKKYKPLNLTSTYNGYTHNKLSLFIYAAMLVKKLVNVDICSPEGDIMVYIISCTKYTLSSLTSNMGKKNSIRLRMDPNGGADIEGNYSRLETESFLSRTTADIPILVKIGTEHMVRQTLIEYDLDMDEYKKAMEYYAISPSPSTDINKYIISTFMGHRLGGAYGINMLRADTYMKLIALTQLYMISLGAHDIVHALTIIPTDKIKTRFSAIDVRIQMNKGAGFAYRNCKRMFPYSIGSSSWDAKAKCITDYIIGPVHTYNTAPNLWELMGEECVNDTTYEYDEFIMKSIFKFINHVLEIAGHTYKEAENG